MLERVTLDNGVVAYRSPLLAATGVVHAFTTRLGGVSATPFDTMNFQPASRSVEHLSASDAAPAEAASATGVRGAGAAATGRSSAPTVDQYESVIENFRRLRAALDCGDRRVICAWQVHGTHACIWPGDVIDPAPQEEVSVVAKADILATRAERVLLAIRVADCVPLLLASRDGAAVAAVHAGWRGVAANAAHAAVVAMRERLGVEPRDLVAAIGPCISAHHFEVGYDVMDAFIAAGLANHIIDHRPRPHIDLPGAMTAQLVKAGVPADRIDRTDQCTFRDRSEFFSHRRDDGRTGRMAAVIGAMARE